ncbi:MAG: hypothetical protein HY094_01890 [Candidatus Melainabacteria bacterium]|nr:hypothetical protein [Candidatus Melainabacteria bacterium]
MKSRTIVFTVILIASTFYLGFWCNSYSQTSSGNNIKQIQVPKKEPDQKINLPVSVQEDSQNQLGLIYSVKKIEEASTLIRDGNIQEAEKTLLSIKNWLTEATDFHYSLFQALSKHSKTLFESKIEKAHALDFAQVRDQSYFLLAKVYIIQNKFKDAVKLLVEIVKSQPDSALAREAYKALQEIKFSDKT